MSRLADEVLPLIRTRSDIHRLGAANAHGRQMHEGIDLLEQAFADGDPKDVLDVTQRALASALKVIMRADDSSGIIGDACRRLIDLHPLVAARAQVAPSKLVRWMIRFQFEEEADFFTPDLAAYGPALGDAGMKTYRAELDRIRSELGPEPSWSDRWGTPNGHTWLVIEEAERRLAVHDRDVDAIIRTHLRDGRVPAWLTDVAAALEEIEEFDAAIDWAKRATDHPTGGHQAIAAAEHWCRLLTEHRPAEVYNARHEVFRRWPNARHAARLYKAAGDAWPDVREEVMSALSANPRETVSFVLGTLDDPALAWRLAHDLDLDDADSWLRVAQAYESLDPRATLPVYTELATETLAPTDARGYRNGARLLAHARALAAGTKDEGMVTQLIAEMRETHRRRPRLQKELDRAGLP